MNNRLYDDIYFTLTATGEKLKAKQNNGYKNSVVCAVPFIDNKKYIKNIYDKNENNLAKITTDDLLNNVTLLLTDISYKQEYGILVYSSQPKSLKNGLTTKIYFNKENNACTYSSWLFPKQFSISKFSEDIKIDGIIYVGKEYKTTMDDVNELENDTSTCVPLAIAYLPGKNKIEILHDQNETLVFNFEYCMSLEESTCNLTIDEAKENETLLHIVDDGSVTNDTTLRDGMGVLGTKNKILMSNVSNAEVYDSYSKLNIMNRLDNKTYPQLAIQYADSSSGKSWDGRRIEFLYTSGTNDINGEYFGIREVIGKNQKHGSNIHLFSNDNKLDENSYENGFVYSRRNTINSGNNDMFVNSDGNNIEDAAYSKFTNSFNNSIQNNKTGKESARNLSIVNSNNNNIIVTPKTLINSDVYAYRTIKGVGLLNTNDSTIYGGTSNTQSLNLINANRSFINTPKDSWPYSQLIFGGRYNYIKGSNGNNILIGNGLTTVEDKNDRIIIGNYNDIVRIEDDDLFIIAAGSASNSLNEKFEQAATGDVSALENSFFRAYSANNDFVKRHNLFTVNKNGKFKIKGKDDCSVEFSTKGIHAYNSYTKSSLDVKYSDIYNKINVDDIVYTQIQEIEKLTNQYEETLNSLTNSYNHLTNGNISLLNDAVSGLPIKNNDIVNVTYINKNSPTNTTLSATINYYMSGANGFGKRSLKIPNGCSQSFLYVNDNDINMTGFSKIV